MSGIVSVVRERQEGRGEDADGKERKDHSQKNKCGKNIEETAPHNWQSSLSQARLACHTADRTSSFRCLSRNSSSPPHGSNP